jgi:hypothetical protein
MNQTINRKYILGLGFLVFSGFCLVPSTSFGKTVKYAVVIGNNAPPEDAPDLTTLQYADDDAIRFHRLIKRFGAESHLFTVPDQNTKHRYPDLIRDAQSPTKQNLKRVAHRLESEMQRDRKAGHKPVLYVWYGGHGTYTDKGRARLPLLDKQISKRFLADQFVEPLPTEYTHFMIDACHAAGIVGGRGDIFQNEASAETKSLSDSDIDTVVDDSLLGKYPNVGVLAAAAPGESSYEWTELSAGVFSHELLSGLLGGADINGDRKIVYSELEAFISAANSQIDNPKAVPTVIAEAPKMASNATLMDLSEVSGPKLVGNPTKFGHFHIETRNGERYLDAHLSTRWPTHFILPRKPAYMIFEDREARIRPNGKDRITFTELRFRPKTSRKRGAIAQSLHKGLFQSEFSRAYYQGYVAQSDQLSVDFDASSSPLRETKTDESGSWRPATAWGLAGTSAALGIASVVTAGFAYGAHNDYQSTPYQKPAHTAYQRYETNLTASIATGAGAAAAGTASYLIWPEDRNQAKLSILPPIGDSSRRIGISLQLPW